MKKNFRAWIPDKKDPKLIRLLNERSHYAKRLTELDLEIAKEVARIEKRIKKV